jgi:hypothetical protein
MSSLTPMASAGCWPPRKNKPAGWLAAARLPPGTSRRRVRERGGVGVDLVEVEASGGVAGFICGEGGAAGFAAHLADQLDDALAEGVGQAGPGVQDGDHRAGVRVGRVDLQASMVQAGGQEVFVAGHGHSSARMPGSTMRTLVYAWPCRFVRGSANFSAACCRPLSNGDATSEQTWSNMDAE